MKKLSEPFKFWLMGIFTILPILSLMIFWIITKGGSTEGKALIWPIVWAVNLFSAVFITLASFAMSVSDAERARRMKLTGEDKPMFKKEYTNGSVVVYGRKNDEVVQIYNGVNRVRMTLSAFISLAQEIKQAKKCADTTITVNTSDLI